MYALRVTVAFLLQFVLSSSLLAGDGFSPISSSGFSQMLRWYVSGQTAPLAEGLYRFTFTGESHRSQLLLITPNAGRVVFTHGIDATNGTISVTLRDPSSGWWLELTEHTSIRKSDMTSWFRAFDPEAVPAGHKVAMSLRTSKGTTFRHDGIRYSSDPTNEHREFAIHLRADTLATALLDEVPAGLLNHLPALDVATRLQGDSPGFLFRSVIELLEDIASHQFVPIEQSIRFEPGARTKGTKLTDSEHQGFAARFGDLER